MLPVRPTAAAITSPPSQADHPRLAQAKALGLGGLARAPGQTESSSNHKSLFTGRSSPARLTLPINSQPMPAAPPSPWARARSRPVPHLRGTHTLAFGRPRDLPTPSSGSLKARPPPLSAFHRLSQPREAWPHLQGPAPGTLSLLHQPNHRETYPPPHSPGLGHPSPWDGIAQGPFPTLAFCRTRQVFGPANSLTQTKPSPALSDARLDARAASPGKTRSLPKNVIWDSQVVTDPSRY